MLAVGVQHWQAKHQSNRICFKPNIALVMTSVNLAAAYMQNPG